MTLNYYTSNSMTKPSLVDETSSKKVTYIRKNIVEETDDDGNVSYTYDECKLSKEDYQKYLEEQKETESQQKIAELEDSITQLQVALVEVYELYSASAE